MNVSLTRELEQMVNRKVHSGLYRSASEVVREALRLMHEHDEERDIRHQELRRLIAVGLADIEAGDTTRFDDDAVAAIKRAGRARRAAATGA